MCQSYPPTKSITWKEAQFYIEAGNICSIEFSPDLVSLTITGIYGLGNTEVNFEITCDMIIGVTIEREFDHEAGSSVILGASLEEVTWPPEADAPGSGQIALDQQECDGYCPYRYRMHLDGEIDVKVSCANVSVKWSGLYEYDLEERLRQASPEARDAFYASYGRNMVRPVEPETSEGDVT